MLCALGASARNATQSDRVNELQKQTIHNFHNRTAEPGTCQPVPTVID
jgi:hypothetical protein